MRLLEAAVRFAPPEQGPYAACVAKPNQLVIVVKHEQWFNLVIARVTSVALVFGMPSMSRPHLRAIDRLARILTCVCALVIAPSVSAFPLYTGQQETWLDFSTSAAPLVVNSAGPDVGAGLQQRWSEAADSRFLDSSPGILATIPGANSSSSNFEGGLLTMPSPPLATPPVPDTELESLTISGMQYSTGLSFDANDCSARGAMRPCGTIEDAFFDLALAWTSGQMSRQDWYET